MSENQPTPTASVEEMRVLLEKMGARKVDAPYIYSEIVTGKPDEEFFQLGGIAIGTLEWFIHNAPDSFLLACLRFMESDEARKVCYVDHFNQKGHDGGQDYPVLFVAQKMKNGKVQMFTGPLESRVVRAACAVAAEVNRAKEGQGK